MCERGSGVIVNVIGVAGERHRSNYIAGTSGNAALIAFTRALGSESVDHGVRVVGVNPGRILTERQIDHMQERAEKEYGDRNRWKDILAEVSETLPFKRTGKPSEVADLVVYLASARASYISGTVITIDAGQSLRTRA
jgi:NAD(P)-dependent dehydrogenase (short-subunit alcohol dehydrogenase family)